MCCVFLHNFTVSCMFPRLVEPEPNSFPFNNAYGQYANVLWSILTDQQSRYIVDQLNVEPCEVVLWCLTETITA